MHPEVDRELQTCLDRQTLSVWGYLNQSGKWLVVEKIIVAAATAPVFEP
ncbi:MAG: hypothetical protein AB1861_10205 [Cyanobacteriota bacterium]